MFVKKEILFKVTLEYGQGYYDLTEKKKEKNDEGQFSTIYDTLETYGKSVLDYHIHKIQYSLKDNKIQSLIITYKNRYKDEEKVLFDTECSHLENETLEVITLKDEEEIEDVLFYVSKEGYLTGICITTTDNDKPQYIGNYVNGEAFKDDNLNKKQNIVISFGANASKNHGVSSIFCYYITKKDFGIIKYLGLLQLKVKLKNDEEFKKKIEEKRNTLDKDKQLLLDVCELPDPAFTPVAVYIMSEFL